MFTLSGFYMLIFHLIITFSGDEMVKKVVQTDLNENEYGLLKETVEKRGLTIKSGLRDAIPPRAHIEIAFS